MEGFKDKIISFLDGLVEWIFDSLTVVFTGINNLGAELFDLNWVKSALNFFQIFGFALYISGLAIALYNIVTDYTSYGSVSFKKHASPIFLGYLFVLLFARVPPVLYVFSCSIQNTFTKDLFRTLTNHDLGLGEVAHEALLKMKEVFIENSFLGVIYIVFILYALIKVFFATIKRSGVLFTMIGVGSLYCFSVSHAGFDGFFRWGKQIVALCITAFLQTTLMTLGLYTLSVNLVIGLGLMMSAGEVDKVAGQFGLDVSAKDSLSKIRQTTLDIIKVGSIISGL